MKSQKRCLSVVIPCFNEEKTLKVLLEKVLSQGCVGQVILIDDGSDDNSVAIAREIQDKRLLVKAKPKNEGKGAAIRDGFKFATLEFVVIQDADLEYDPLEYSALLEPLLSGKADVVYGSRFLFKGNRKVLKYWHTLGNRFLSSTKASWSLPQCLSRSCRISRCHRRY